MCGRFTLRAAADIVVEQFGVDESGKWKPRFNIAPSQPVAAVRATTEAASARELIWLRWGLIPAWAKDAKIGNRLINARAETVAEKPAFRNSLRSRRCLILADGFYEWRKEGKRKIPYFIRLLNDRPFAFAGLWELWTDPNNSTVESCTLITTSANEIVRPIHDRMPVLLARKDYTLWLDSAVTRPEPLLSLLRPYPSDEMEAFQVSPFVNNATNDDPQCVEPA